MSWLALKHFKTVGKRWGILERGLLHVITRSIAEMMYETSYKGWIFVVLQVLKLLSIAWEPWTTEQVFCTLLPRALAKWNTLQSSSIYTPPIKKRNFPCCVSFEEKCMPYPSFGYLAHLLEGRCLTRSTNICRNIYKCIHFCHLNIYFTEQTATQTNKKSPIKEN